MLTPEEIQKDITTYRARLANPAGLSQAQIDIYQQAIIEAQQLLQQFTDDAPPRPEPKPETQNPKPETRRTTVLKNTGATDIYLNPDQTTNRIDIPSPNMRLHLPADDVSVSNPETDDAVETRNPKPETLNPVIRHAGPAPTAAPITSRIEVEHNTDPHNPRITITWSDHYTITVDETAARSNFTNRMRDTCALKCVARYNRFEKIWKYYAPWRAAGFYQALTWFWDGKPPALTQIGITRPTETYKKIFALITADAGLCPVEQPPTTK